MRNLPIPVPASRVTDAADDAGFRFMIPGPERATVANAAMLRGIATAWLAERATDAVPILPVA